jgi:DNA-binding LacI/PurR family transcriptional regulator
VTGTLDDVAARAGVSRVTVSNAYGRPEVVAASTRERVLAAAAELGYGGPSPVGRTLRRGSTEVLGILVNVGIAYTLSDPGAAQFMRGVAQGADEAEVSLQLVHASGPTARLRVMNTAVDAFIAWSLPADDPALLAAIERRVTIVAVGGARGVPNVPYVSADDVGGARLAAQHLLDLGIRRFAALGALAGEQFSDRVTGWRTALEAGGIDWSTVVQIGRGGNTRADGAAAAEAFLDVREAGTRWGVLALTDVLALGALQALRTAGVDVPNEVAVVGFDDIDESATTSPALTTVHQDLFALGRECALRAVGRMSGPIRLHPTSLIVRGSTDPRAEPTPEEARP